MSEQRLIDANALKMAFEEDGHLSGYIEEYINDAPTIATAHRWIPVTERLPEDDAQYLTYTTEYTCAVYNYDGDGEWVTEWGEEASHDITHWMPLPSAPGEVSR